MAFNPADLFKIKGTMANFNANHPKLIPFFRAAEPKIMTVGSVIEMSVTDPNGEKLETNIKVQESDIELIHMLMEMGANGQ